MRSILASAGRRAMATWVPALAVLVTVLTLASCGEGERGARPAAADAVDSLAAQPDRPLLPAGAVEVAESFRLSPAARAEANLERPLDVAYDAGGSLYVLDGSSPTRVLKFDDAGQFQYRFGRHEPDVERIARATSFAISPWNTVLMIDKAHNLLVSFLTMGTFVGAVEIHGVGMNVLPLSDFGEFYLQKWDSEMRRAYVVRMRAPFDSLGTPYSIGIPAGQSVRKEARDVAFKTAVDREDRLYVAFADAYPVRVLEPDGRTVRLVGIDRPPVAKSPAAIEAERARNYREVEERLPDISDALKEEAAEPEPAHLMIEELVVDPSGRLWVRTHRPERAGDTAYDVFNAEGHFLAVVWIPAEVRRTAFAPDGSLLTIQGPSDTSREIVAYRVRFDGAAAEGTGSPADEGSGSPADETAPGAPEAATGAEDASEPEEPDPGA